MHPFAQVVLPGIVVASALGALVMCLLVLAFGFPSPRAGEGEPEARVQRRLLLTRLGHAVGGVCFAVAGILAVMAIAHQRSTAVAPPPAAAADTRAETDGLRRDLQALDARLGQAESRLTSAESRRERDDPRVAQLAARADRTESRPAPPPRPTPTRRDAAATAPSPARPAPAPPRPLPAEPPANELSPRSEAPESSASPPMSSPPSLSLAGKVRQDWENLKRDTRSAAEGVKGAWRRVRDWVAP